MFIILNDSEDNDTFLCEAKHFRDNFDEQKFLKDWEDSLAAIKEATGEYGYTFGHVGLEMKKRGWILTIMEHLKLEY